MKTYILTEEQINKALSKKGIKKGIGLKINEGDSFYYKSIIKEFEDENDFETWKDNLSKNKKIIGVINIDEESKS